MIDMKRMLRVSVAMTLLASGAVFGEQRAVPTAPLATTKPAETPPLKPVGTTETDRMEFTQKNVQAQMQELQERMFRLAELTKEAEPDNSTRLLLAVRKAREELIIEQMKEILEKLASKDLTNATAETKAVLVKLNDLRALLIATDLDLQLQLARLRALNAVIKKVDTAIREEKKQEANTGELAKKPEPKPGELEAAKKEQEANRKRAEEAAEAAKAMGNMDKATTPLGASGKSMSQAEGSLGQSKPGEAGQSQADATKKLEEARNALEKERQQVLAELQKQVRKVVQDNLQDMLDRQVAIRGATEALSPKLKERAAVMQLQQLAPAEERIATICQTTLSLVNETEFSVALPPALENLHRNILYVAGDLTGGRGDQRVIATEIGIEQDIRELIETFKELAKAGDQQGGECKGCKGNKNKLVAELKVLRMLQLSVNRATLDADGDAHRAAAAAELPQHLRDKIGKARDIEDAIKNAMKRLHEQYGPDSQQPEEEERDPNTI
jgi:hypothetical protein